MKFHEQMKLLKNENENYDNVWPHDDWDIQDYKDMFWLIDRGYLVQQSFGNSFMVNEDWEGEDIYEEVFGEPTNPICPSCGDEWTEATRCDCPNEESVE